MSQRAKQFMPFAALKGYQEALKEKERVLSERIELSEDQQRELNDRLLELKRGDGVELVYYEKGEYLKLAGLLVEVNEINKTVTVGMKTIRAANIRSLKKI